MGESPSHSLAAILLLFLLYCRHLLLMPSPAQIYCDHHPHFILAFCLFHPQSFFSAMLSYPLRPLPQFCVLNPHTPVKQYNTVMIALFTSIGPIRENGPLC